MGAMSSGAHALAQHVAQQLTVMVVESIWTTLHVFICYFSIVLKSGAKQSDYLFLTLNELSPSNKRVKEELNNLRSLKSRLAEIWTFLIFNHRNALTRMVAISYTGLSLRYVHHLETFF